MAEIVPVVSESLEAQVRRLLPSQRGFGEDLQASNVIMPVIDLTPTAEGSVLPYEMQTAAAFGSITAWSASNATVTLANSPGFWRIFGTASGVSGAAVSGAVLFSLSDGLSSKTFWQLDFQQTADDQELSESFDFVVFLDAGESLSAQSTGATFKIQGSYRQIADSSGNLTDPAGFNPQ